MKRTMFFLTIFSILIALFCITVDEIPKVGTLNLNIPWVHIPVLEGGPSEDQAKSQTLLRSRRQIPREKTSRREVAEISSHRLKATLNDLPFSGDKLKYLRTHFNSMPKSFSLTELNGILDLFPFSGDKLEVAKLLRPRLDTQFSDDDLRGFRDHFPFSGDKLKAIDLLYGK